MDEIDQKGEVISLFLKLGDIFCRDPGLDLLFETYQAEYIKYARIMFLYDKGIQFAVAGMFGKSDEMIPLPVKLVLMEITLGERQVGATPKYDPVKAWDIAIKIISLRLFATSSRYKKLRENVEIESGEADYAAIKLVFSMILKLYYEVRRRELGIGKTAMKKLIAEVEQRLKKLPKL